MIMSISGVFVKRFFHEKRAIRLRTTLWYSLDHYFCQFLALRFINKLVPVELLGPG